MSVHLTITQRQRLVELNAPIDLLDLDYDGTKQRDDFFKSVEAQLARDCREQLLTLMHEDRQPEIFDIENRLIQWLCKDEGFTQVRTPIIITETMLSKMTITTDHALANQVFWLEGKKCLRPMLAPNLYELMRDIRKVTKQPVRIFECGPCFRKETQGAQHMNEFTMLNCVELAGVEDGDQMRRLTELAKGAMKAIGFEDYELAAASSEVYGETLDIVSGDLELASGAYGPHVLDGNWGIFDTWVGIGFGIERIAMAKAGYQNIKRVGRGLSYIDGIRLNV
jgi:pyrrolysyl-tRNA synthetase-like protein